MNGLFTDFSIKYNFHFSGRTGTARILPLTQSPVIFPRPSVLSCDPDFPGENPYDKMTPKELEQTRKTLEATLEKQLDAFFKSEGVDRQDYSTLDRSTKIDFYLEKLKAKAKKPSFFKKKEKEKDHELLVDHHNLIKQTLIKHFAGHDVKLSTLLHSIINYMNENCELNEIQLTKTTARLYLTHVKIVDLALAEFNQGRKFKKNFPRSSFELRSQILKLCSPLMTTSEAYTKTLDPRKFKNRHYLSENCRWIPERAAQHAIIAANQLILMQKLSKNLKSPLKSLFAYRGNTASGKSELIDQDLSSLGTKKNRGVFTPDIFKLFLRRLDLKAETSGLVNNQVHDEGVALFKSLMDAMKRKAICQNLVMEGRLSTIEELKDSVLKVARKQFNQVCLKDNASSLQITLYRILTRDPFTHQCPPLNEIIKGHKESILYRKKLLEIVSKDRSIREFTFHYQDEKGRRYVVAEKKQNHFVVHHPDQLEHSCVLPSDLETDQIVQQPVRKEQIALAISQGLISEKSRSLLLKWEGIPLGKSIEFHAMAISPVKAQEKIRKENAWREMYGEVCLEKFDAAWLNDFPSFVSHIKSDQLLTVRGADEKGEGLHWQTNKFSWKLNPKFNPDAQHPDSPRGGFQMKVGYFVIPLGNSEILTAKNLSPQVLKELEVHSKEGKLIGHRLFVHPEGYAHYRKLHAQGIRFVQPKDSEFMGTPTSSYRSWVLRRISSKEKTLPFIAKMGVSSSPSDVTKLLPKGEVQASLKAQIYLDNIPEEKFKRGGNGSDLLFFEENFGLSLKNIKNYPPSYAFGEGDSVDSGMIIREIPNELLNNNCKFLSLSALMSVERSKSNLYGLSKLTGTAHWADALPLIYEIIQTAIEKRLVSNTADFLRKYFIDGYLDAVEELYMNKGVSFAPHGQNLCFVLNADNTPRGWAYRDFEGMQLSGHKGYLETYSWFYRYHVFLKLLNVLVLTDKRMPEPFGAPTQLGAEKGTPERTLESYISKNIAYSTKIHAESLGVMLHLHISPQTYRSLLLEMDQAFLKRLNKYFNLKESSFLMPDGSIPAAEGGSSGEFLTQKSNSDLWQHRRNP